jgi:crossover junction endodeoxyribonuclease RusA
MIVVILPWPPAQLNPNFRSRSHWPKTNAAKQYRRACWALTKQARLCVEWSGPVYLRLTFVPPNRRSRDHDNLIASMKAGLDGLADGLGLDDSRFRLLPAVVASEVGGMVRVELRREGSP